MTHIRHKMKLADDPFKLIDSGIKTVEYRLNDEKRQQLCVGDTIIFSQNHNDAKQLKVTVKKLEHFNTLLEMYTATFNSYLSRIYDSPQSAVDDTPYYSPEQIDKYGCIAIYFEKINL